MILTTVFIQIQNQNKFIENLKLFKKRNPKTLKVLKINKKEFLSKKKI